MDIEVITTPGLGNSSYLLASGRDALVVDPPRDAWRVTAILKRRGWRLRHVVETHAHNDYLSGALELRAGHRADVVLPARGGYRFEHRPADDGTEIELGDLGLVALAAPGHTPEHLAWQVVGAAGRPDAVFTGGSLLIGGVGRTDLLGADRTEALTDAQFATIRRLAALPDTVRVLPTHGAGSFCVAAPSEHRGGATIGDLRRSNPAFGIEDPAEFRRLLAAGRTRFPDYYRHMAPLNRSGPAVHGALTPPPRLSPDELAAAAAAGARVIDARPREAFAVAHVPGSLNIELQSSFASYVGWLVPFGALVALVVARPRDAVEAATELFRIGYEAIVGYLPGVNGWERSGRTVGRYPLVSVAAVLEERASGASPQLLDVRQPTEWRDEGVLPDSRRIFVADLPAAIAGLPRREPWTVICGSGARASIAASLLDAAGLSVRLVAEGGVPSVPRAELVAG